MRNSNGWRRSSDRDDPPRQPQRTFGVQTITIPPTARAPPTNFPAILHTLSTPLRRNGWFLLALGGAFGFISVVVAIAYESYWQLPGGVVRNDYVTVGRRTVDTEIFERLSILDYERIRARAPEAEWAWARGVHEWRTQDEAAAGRKIAAREVSANYLAVLGVAAAHGQTAPSLLAGESVAVISHRLWRQLGGGDYVGTALPLERSGLWADFASQGKRLIPVAGVAAPAFAGLDETVDLWILGSLNADDPFDGGSPDTRVFGALDQELTPARLRELLTEHRFTTQLTKKEDGRKTTMNYNVSANDRLDVVPGLETRPDLRRDTRQRLAWLAALGAMLLALAFQALVERLIATHSAREEALAARLAAGATPGDLLRHSVGDNLGAMALAATVAVLAFFYLADVLLGVPPFATAIGAFSAKAILAGLLCSFAALALAFGLSTAHVSRLVSRRARSYSARRRQGGLARGQLLFIGGACLLLAASVGWRYLHTARADLGFANTDALKVGLMYRGDWQTWNHATALAQAAALPLVRSVAVAERSPLGGVAADLENKVRLRDRAGPDDPVFYRNAVSAGFFSTLDVRFLAGRPFQPGDRAEVVLSRAMALRLADNAEAVLGKALEFVVVNENQAFFWGMTSAPVVTVVGVVADVPFGRLGEGAELVFYGPPRTPAMPGFRWLLTYTGEADEVVEAIKGLPSVRFVYSSETVVEARWRELARQHGVEAVLAAAGGFAFLLAMAGVGAALARDVAARRRDTDVHFAIGGLPANLTRRYGAAVIRDVLLAAAALGAAVLVAKRWAPAFASVVELWLLALVVPALLAVCIGTLHLSFRRAAR